MSDLFGHTRTVIKSRYALITPDGFVPSNLPGWKGQDALAVLRRNGCDVPMIVVTGSLGDPSDYLIENGVIPGSNR